MKTHEEYGYNVKTILANESYVCENNERIRWVESVGLTASFQGRERGASDSTKNAWSSTGVWTGADAECKEISGKDWFNFDKIYVATGSAVRIYIVSDEVV